MLSEEDDDSMWEEDSQQQETPLDVGELPSRKAITTKPTARSGIAHRIIWIFGSVIAGNLILNFLLVAVLILRYQCQADQIEGIVSKGVIPLLTSTGTFAATLFGPLLAFILGYYFRQRGQDTSPD